MARGNIICGTRKTFKIKQQSIRNEFTFIIVLTKGLFVEQTHVKGVYSQILKYLEMLEREFTRLSSRHKVFKS